MEVIAGIFSKIGALWLGTSSNPLFLPGNIRIEASRNARSLVNKAVNLFSQPVKTDVFHLVELVHGRYKLEAPTTLPLIWRDFSACLR